MSRTRADLIVQPNASTLRWGRWKLEGERYLVYQADDGYPSLFYDVDTTQIDGTRTLSEWLAQLREKIWVTEDDLLAFQAACEYSMKSRLLDEWCIDAPSAMSWENYRLLVETEWSSFLEKADPNDEPVFHAFFESYPSLLPGPYGVPALRRHGVLFGGVISQPELPGVRPKHPDFLLFEHDSANVYAILIEIEAPGKSWCTQKGKPTQEFTQAHDQIRDWKRWFSDPKNMIAFRDLYRIGPELLRYRRLELHYVLIYGRRDDATRIESFAQKRRDIAADGEFIMSYDRLRTCGSDDMTLKFDKSGPDVKFRVHTLPPNFSLNTRNALLFSKLTGREDAIRACTLISEPRRQFLLERIPFADSYAQKLSKNFFV